MSEHTTQEPKCKNKVKSGESIEVDFCYSSSCHFCNDPYVCGIPHYLKHQLEIEHEENGE